MYFRSLVFAFCLSASLRASTPDDALFVRGRRQEVHYIASTQQPARAAVVFAPGDGGWRGFAIDMAHAMASWGFDVYGVDTRHYLESFTGARALTEAEVMADWRAVGEWVKTRTSAPVIFAGWSEGAGMGVLATAPDENKRLYSGFVAIGLPDVAILGWRWSDAITWVTKQQPNEPSFATVGYLPRVSPLPLVMIQSTGDEYTSLGKVKEMFAAVREPKRLLLVQASDHRFVGGRDRFYSSLKEALEWVLLNRH